MPFYKNTNNVIVNEDRIRGDSYRISDTNKDDYIYPIDGWYWFRDDVEALWMRNTLKISMRQARLALLQNGLLDSVNAAVGQMPAAVQIEWEYATEVQRDNVLVIAMQQLFGWTGVQMDNLFTLARTL